MRSRAEILLDAIKPTGTIAAIPATADRLSLLTLEVLVDIRDVLNERPLETDKVTGTLMPV